jgi:hypothetical protein
MSYRILYTVYRIPYTVQYVLPVCPLLTVTYRYLPLLTVCRYLPLQVPEVLNKEVLRFLSQYKDEIVPQVKRPSFAFNFNSFKF